MIKTEKQETDEYLRNIVLNLPDSPGCYQYLDSTGKIIYVGKAKNLKRRVYSYFSKDHQSRKTALLVDKIRDIKYIVVKTEEDALLLENNLIKQHKPHYNILLKDDKTYPSICVTNETYPRIFKTRRIDKRGATYFGPYSHMPTLNALLELIKKLYPLRTCHLPLHDSEIEHGKYKVCLEYHIKNCKGPCIGAIAHEEYMQYINEAKEILKGNTAQVEQKIYQEMQELAREMKFEEAQQLKLKYDMIAGYRSKSEVVSNTIHNVDVFAIEMDGNNAFVNFLHVINGCINQAFTFCYKTKIDETQEDILALAIVEMRERYKSQSKEIIVPFMMDVELDNVGFTIPQKGDKKKLLELSQLNVKQYKVDQLKQADKLNPEQRTTRMLKEIQQHLSLNVLPTHIECFDNSNISGSHAVAGCVVYKNGKPSKKDYRSYNIKTVAGPDDYASMQEVVRRRYTRMIKEENKLPNLIITDGGKGQMEVVRQVIEDELHLNIPIAGLAKDDKHRTHELLFGFPPKVIGLKPESATFRLLTQMQDEVHRFAITLHRNKRSRAQTESELDHIKGIGEKTKSQLLKKFRSVKRIKEASIEEIATEIGAAKARIVLEKLLEKQ